VRLAGTKKTDGVKVDPRASLVGIGKFVCGSLNRTSNVHRTSIGIKPAGKNGIKAITNAMNATPDRDVFVSYNSLDHAAVERIARALDDRGLSVFLDRWELVPGRPWFEQWHSHKCTKRTIFDQAPDNRLKHQPFI